MTPTWNRMKRSNAKPRFKGSIWYWLDGSTCLLQHLDCCSYVPFLKKNWGRRGWDEKLIVIDWARQGTYTAIERGFLVCLVYLQRMLWIQHESHCMNLATFRLAYLHSHIIFWFQEMWEDELWCLPFSSSPKIKKSTSINNHVESYETYDIMYYIHYVTL